MVEIINQSSFVEICAKESKVLTRKVLAVGGRHHTNQRRSDRNSMYPEIAL